MKRAFFIILLAGQAEAISLVYNLKIRRSFTGLASFLNLQKKPSYALTAVPIFYYRKARFIVDRTETDVRDTRHGGGTIINVRVPAKHWWLEGTTAVHKESAEVRGTTCLHASRASFDDIVFAGGYNAFPSKNHQITLYGLAGFPTTRRFTLEDAQTPLVGSRFYGLGGGIEYSYSYINTPERLLAGIIQGRILHFFTREAEVLLGPEGKLQPGQTIDLLLSIRYRRKRTVLEMGYNPTVFINTAVILPAETFPAEKVVRHGGYIGVLHLTKSGLGDALFAVGGGLIYNRITQLEAHSVSALLNFTLVF